MEFHRARAFARDEPRVELIERLLKSILQVAELEYDGKPVKVDGFRLRDLNQWRTATETSLQDNLGSVSTVCNCHCAFCYEDGNPPGLFEKQPRFVSMAEARTRSRYLHDGRGLFREAKGYFEPLAHPDFFALLELIREHDPDHVIDVTTNGSLLTSEAVSRLAHLKPVYVNISLISADETIRRSVMRDSRARDALRAVELLRTAEIPFMGTLVPWPSQGVEDITNAIAYLDAHDAVVIRVALPGLSRHHPRSATAIPREWVPMIAKHAMALRPSFRTPIVVSPHSYISTSIEPIVEGIVTNSPASVAGIQLGDRIISIDGQEVVSRAHASSLLKRASENGRATITVSRDGVMTHTLMSELAPPEDAYPYKPRGYRALRHPGLTFGLCLPGSFHLQYLKQIHTAISKRQAKHTVVVSSPYFHTVAKELISQLPLPASSRVDLVVPKSEFFGGSVNIGDLWVLEDIYRAVHPLLNQSDRPDLLLLPSSFLSHLGKDLRGVSYRELEAIMNIDVALIECERIMM